MTRSRPTLPGPNPVKVASKLAEPHKFWTNSGNVAFITNKCSPNLDQHRLMPLQMMWNTANLNEIRPYVVEIQPRVGRTRAFGTARRDFILIRAKFRRNQTILCRTPAKKWANSGRIRSDLPHICSRIWASFGRPRNCGHHPTTERFLKTPSAHDAAWRHHCGPPVDSSWLWLVRAQAPSHAEAPISQGAMGAIDAPCGPHLGLWRLGVELGFHDRELYRRHCPQGGAGKCGAREVGG